MAGGSAERYSGVAQREQDTESGLVYMRNRMYDPSLGRFTQTDPILGNRPGKHYAYASNNPLGIVDPMGLGDESLWERALETAFPALGSSRKLIELGKAKIQEGERALAGVDTAAQPGKAALVGSAGAALRLQGKILAKGEGYLDLAEHPWEMPLGLIDTAGKIQDELHKKGGVDAILDFGK